MINDKSNLAEKRKSKRPIMWAVSVVILIVIVVTFIGAPIAGKISSGGSLVFGSYDGEEIIYQEGTYFAEQVYSVAEEYRDQITEQNSQFVQFQVWKTAFDNTVFRTAIIKELKNSGVKISSAAIDKAIVTYGPYMENGEFSENLYAQSSNTEKRLTRKRFEEDLYYGQFITDINANTINLNEKEFFEDLGKIEKKYRYTAFPFTSFPDSRVEEYGKSNSELFREIYLSKITVNTDRKDAEQLLTRLEQDPGLFSELARTQSSDPYADKGGEMGARFYYDLQTLITSEGALDELFSLGQGEISGIIVDDNSWVIYRSDRAPENLDLSIDSNLTIVRDYMEQFEKGLIEDYLVEKADQFVDTAEEEGFQDSAASMDYEIKETNYFPIIYGSPSVYFYEQNMPIYTEIAAADGSPALQGAANNKFFLKSINSLGNEVISEPLILNDSVYVMQQVATREKSQEELEPVSSLLGYAAQNWQGNRLQKIIFESEKFEDNFTAAFSRLFLSN